MANVTPISEVIDLSEFGSNPYQITIAPQPTTGGSFGTTTPAVPAPNGGVNCPSVMMHINSCPLCNKLYNPDRTLYILLIVILAVICLVLMKRVMDKH